MTTRRILPMLLALLMLLAASVPAPAAGPAQWSVAAKAKFLADAHTSYEFGNPLSPGQVPLSRLEFPLQSWWGGLGVARRGGRWWFDLELYTNLTGELPGLMKDSDWDDEESPSTRTIYSESSCRMRRSYIGEASLGLEVADWLGLPSRLSLGPVTGVRHQYFDLVTHDGTQWQAGGADGTAETPLPGDGIAFDQTYWQYFLGLRATLDLQPRPDAPVLELSLQGDWAYVDAHNEDHHLLREGNRRTIENTRGDAWHLGLGLRAGLGRDWVLGLAAEYLKIHTTGSHQLLNNALDLDHTFDRGVTVWSEQISFTLSLEYLF